MKLQLCVLLSGLLGADAFASATPGWENICVERTAFPLSTILWQAQETASTNFMWSLREGAKGEVTFGPKGIHIRKDNDEGYILVTAQPFKVTVGQGVRFSADHEVPKADVDYSSGVLRAFGRTENLVLDGLAERRNFWLGGLQTMRGLPCTAPGMTYRKYGQVFAKEDVLTPAIVVSGAPSESIWRNWTAEDLMAAENKWNEREKEIPSPNWLTDREDATTFAADLAADHDHVAEVKHVAGYSRLLVDGEIVAPAVYKGQHAGVERFAGTPLDGSAVRVMVTAVTAKDYSNADGSKVNIRAMIEPIRDAMRLAPKSVFVIAVGGQAPPEFIRKRYPEEAWINEQGKPVLGLGGSCIIGYLGQTAEQFAKNAIPWPSPSSKVWRKWVCDIIRDLVAEMKAEGLAKRVVGIHVYGYHDAQYSIPYTDHSKPAQEEYRQMIAEKNCISTNYAFCLKQSGFRAQEEFVRTFKKAMGKPTIGVMWCESPFQGAKNASLDLTSFTRSDAMDIVVCQPDYRERQPGFPTVSALPMASLHLHGKIFWNEYDYRTYAPTRHTGDSPISFMSLGGAADFPMWQSMYRKVVGEADATRMGYWFFDMQGGWYHTPAIAADIRRLVREETALARITPSTWRPEVAIVLDEPQILQEGDDPLLRITMADEYIYAASRRLFGTSGVPHERWLAADVLENPSLLDDKKMVIFAFFRAIDATRAALAKRLAARGTTLVWLSESGVRGGAEATGFEPIFTKGKFEQRTVPEPGVKENVANLANIWSFRHQNASRERGDRCTVRETPGVEVLARYASDHLPAVAVRKDADCRRVYVAGPGGLTPALMNRFAREAGAYVTVDGPGLQVNMNGDFMSLHCLQPGAYLVHLPFACRVMNMRSYQFENVRNKSFEVSLTAGETCRFRLLKTVTEEVEWQRIIPELRMLDNFTAETVDQARACIKQGRAAKQTATDLVPRRLLNDYVAQFNAVDEELYTNAIPNSAAAAWMSANVPRFECPDADIERTYYFRWWTYRKHIRAAPLGWVVTEFLPKVSWSGPQNTIVCAAGHHFMEGRWLRDPQYLTSYARFWFNAEGSTKRYAYSTWLAYAIDAMDLVRGDDKLGLELLDGFVQHYRRWETQPDLRNAWPKPGKAPMGGDGKGLFLSTDNCEGSEFSLSGHGYRPLFNSAMYAEATTIAALARRAGRRVLADEFSAKADVLAKGIKANVWNDERGFFTARSQEGAHSPVRELHGYAPWYFAIPLGTEYDTAWQWLDRDDGFRAPQGLTFPERAADDFTFAYDGHECQWNGPSWPFATSIALTALRNRLQRSDKELPAVRPLFARLMHQYATQQVRVREDGVTIPWIDEDYHPLTGDWISRTVILNTPKMKARFPRERGKDYNHSTFCDLVISGLCGLVPQSDDSIVVRPLAPENWDWWCLDGIRYQGHDLTILFDRTGHRYGRGQGLIILRDGKLI